MKNIITAFLLLLVGSVGAQSFDKTQSTNEIITVLFGGQWNEEEGHCAWLPINKEEEDFFYPSYNNEPTVFHTREWVDYKYPKNGTEHRIILTETENSYVHLGWHTFGKGISRIILELNKKTQQWDVLTFDRMWQQMGSWGHLRLVDVELVKLAENEYGIMVDFWDWGQGVDIFYKAFYLESGDKIAFVSAESNAAAYGNDDIRTFFFDTEIDIDSKAGTLTFHRTGTEYGGGYNEPAMPVDETTVYKVIDGKFVLQPSATE